MRTKQLLWTIALPALFAACTSEDVFDAGQEASALANRPLAGDVEFALAGADTRVAKEVNEGFTFDDGDAVGVCLVDTWTKGTDSEKEWNNYELTDYIQSNYKWKYNAARNTFTSVDEGSQLVAGNYILYYPFNANNVSREPLQVVTPLEQTLDVKDGKVVQWSAVTNAMKDATTPYLVGYAFLDSDPTNAIPKVEYQHIFAYPKFTITNGKKNESIKVKKVAIKTTSKFDAAAELNISNGVSVSCTTGGVVGNLFNGYASGLDEKKNQQNGNWALTANELKTTQKLSGTPTANLLKKTTDLTTSKGAKADVVILTLTEAITLAPGEAIVFNAVMPAQDLGTAMKAYVYEDNTQAYEVDLDPTKEGSETVAGYVYLEQDYKLGSWTLADQSNPKLARKIGNADELMTPDGVDVPYIVANEKELIEKITTKNQTLHVIPTGKLVITQATIDAMLKVTEQSVEILGDATLSGKTTKLDTGAETLNIDGNTTIEGDVTLGTKTKLGDWESETTCTIASGADVTNKGTITALYGLTNNGKLTNTGTIYGTVDNKGAASEIVKSTTTLNVWNNEGTISDYSNITLDANNNKGTVKVVDITKTTTLPTTLVGTWIVDTDKAKAATSTTLGENGTLQITEGSKLTDGTISVGKNATIDVQGTLESDVTLDGVAEEKDGVTTVSPAKVLLGAKSAMYGKITGNTDNDDDEAGDDFGGSYMEPDRVEITYGAYLWSGCIDNANLACIYDMGNVNENSTVDNKIQLYANVIKMNDVRLDCDAVTTPPADACHVKIPFDGYRGTMIVSGDAKVATGTKYGAQFDGDTQVFEGDLHITGKTNETRMNGLHTEIAGNLKIESDPSTTARISWNTGTGVEKVLKVGKLSVANPMTNSKLTKIWVGDLDAEKKIAFMGAKEIHFTGGQIRLGGAEGMAWGSSTKVFVEGDVAVNAAEGARVGASSNTTNTWTAEHITSSTHFASELSVNYGCSLSLKIPWTNTSGTKADPMASVLGSTPWGKPTNTGTVEGAVTLNNVSYIKSGSGTYTWTVETPTKE